jgi:16S rRNA processing protein RimM
MIGQKPLVVGTFGAPYGVQGWLKVHAATENRHHILNYQPWFIQKNGCWSPVRVAAWKQQSDRLLVKLTGISDRTAAQAMVQQHIAIDAAQLPLLPSGGYYWCQLLGCQVVTVADCSLGIVAKLLETGANDVLVVTAHANDAYGMTERLIPWIEPAVVQQVDIARRQVTVDWDPEF